MDEMIKDEKIERTFRRYFDGLPMPNVDLTEAKAALRAQNMRRRSRRRGLISVLSVAGCLLVAIVLSAYLLPSAFITRYAIADAQTATIGYTELTEQYADAASMFSVFSLADNASADYTLYRMDGKDVLLRADLKFLSGNVKLKATVQVDLTEGKYVAEELENYKKLKDEGNGYRYNTEEINGEYVSRAYCKREATVFYVDVTSQNSEALGFLMKVLMR